MDTFFEQNMKLPFTGSAPLNSTEETEKSATPDIANTAEALNGITSTPELMASKEEKESSVPATATPTPNAIPDALVYKYNRYCDRIYERIGSILKTKYDPVSVLLSTSITKKQGVKKTSIKKKKR